MSLFCHQVKIPPPPSSPIPPHILAQHNLLPSTPSTSNTLSLFHDINCLHFFQAVHIPSTSLQYHPISPSVLIVDSPPFYSGKYCHLHDIISSSNINDVELQPLYDPDKYMSIKPPDEREEEEEEEEEDEEARLEGDDDHDFWYARSASASSWASCESHRYIIYILIGMLLITLSCVLDRSSDHELSVLISKLEVFSNQTQRCQHLNAKIKVVLSQLNRHQLWGVALFLMHLATLLLFALTCVSKTPRTEQRWKGRAMGGVWVMVVVVCLAYTGMAIGLSAEYSSIQERTSLLFGGLSKTETVQNRSEFRYCDVDEDSVYQVVNKDMLLLMATSVARCLQAAVIFMCIVVVQVCKCWFQKKNVTMQTKF